MLNVRKNWAAIALGVAVLGLILTAGAPRAAADTVNTLYCTGGNTCYATAADAGSSYWEVTSDISTSGSSFTYTLTITSVGESTIDINHFSAQYFFGNSASVSNLQWVSGESNGWSDLEANKGSNGGSCGGNATGSFCGSSTGTADVSLASGGTVTFGVTGDYTGTFLDSNGAWNFMLSATNASGNGNALAISQSIVPEPATLSLLGTGLLVLAGAARRRMFRR